MKKIFIAVAACVFLLSGCTNNTGIPNETLGSDSNLSEEEPDDSEGEEVIGLSWFEANIEAFEFFTEEVDDALYSKDFAVEFNEGTNTIHLRSVIDDSATPEEALNYAAEILRKFNDQIISIQMKSLESSSDASYGGIYKDYNVEIQVTNESNLNDESKFFVNTIIPAGAEYKALELQK